LVCVEFHVLLDRQAGRVVRTAFVWYDDCDVKRLFPVVVGRVRHLGDAGRADVHGFHLAHVYHVGRSVSDAEVSSLRVFTFA